MDMQHYSGISNASGALALDSKHFIVADDEHNALSIYAYAVTAKPLQSVSLSALFNAQIKDGEDHEIDLEGVAAIGNCYFWIGSHSTSRKGKPRPDRHRLLATYIKPATDGKFTVLRLGEIYTQLIADLRNDSRFDAYQFAKAQGISPKDIGGLSIEGLAATPEQSLLIGFRNPLAGGEINDGQLLHGRALLINLLNPFEVMAGHSAEFGDPVELALAGLGIRDIVWHKGQEYLIVAGPYHDNSKITEASVLYLWAKDTGKLERLSKIDLAGLNIEAAFFSLDQPGTLQLLSDDGKNTGFHNLSVAI